VPIADPAVPEAQALYGLLVNPCRAFAFKVR